MNSPMYFVFDHVFNSSLLTLSINMLVNILKYTILYRDLSLKNSYSLYTLVRDCKDNYTEKVQINYFALIQNLHNTQQTRW